ncbi:MAG TPA: hypothetical protein VF076_04790 [Acidimicrobiales bacterium]
MVELGAPTPRPALDPVIGWRAEYGPGEYVADPGAYLALDRTRLTALAICVFHEAGVDVVAELKCSGAVFRRRVALSSDGTRAVAWLLGCPCHDQLVRIDGAGVAPFPGGFASVELFPQERLP